MCNCINYVWLTIILIGLSPNSTDYWLLLCLNINYQKGETSETSEWWLGMGPLWYLNRYKQCPVYMSAPESNFHVTHNLSKYQVSNDMIILLHPSMLITLFCRHAIIGRLGAQIALTMLWLHYHRTGHTHNNNVLCFIRCKKWHIHPV